MAEIGFNGIGTTGNVYTYGSGILTRFTPTSDGDIDDLYAYLEQAGGGWSGDQVGMAVFNMSNNKVKCYSALRDTIADAPAWYQFTGLTEVEANGLKVFNGQEIGIAIWTNVPGSIRAYSSVGTTGQSSENTDDESFSTWNDWDEVSALDIKLSAYLNYTPSGGGGDETKFFFGVQ
jgi:hypothetical protein